MDINEFLDREFKTLIGHEKIKTMMREWANALTTRKILEEAGVDMEGEDGDGYHMVFSGNPGTGKTHIAKLCSKLLLRLGNVCMYVCSVCMYVA
jgi:DNA replication protein DnaC